MYQIQNPIRVHPWNNLSENESISNSVMSNFCYPMDYSLLGSSVHGIFQARTLEWVGISFSGNIADSGIEPASLASPALAGRFFTTVPPGKLTCLLVTQFSFPDLENPGVPLCFSLVPFIHSPQA